MRSKFLDISSIISRVCVNAEQVLPAIALFLEACPVVFFKQPGNALAVQLPEEIKFFVVQMGIYPVADNLNGPFLQGLVFGFITSCRKDRNLVMCTKTGIIK